MSLRDYRREIVESFLGSWSILDETDVGKERALQARNVRFFPGKVKSRDGHLPVLTSTSGVTTLYDWIASGFSTLIYRDGNDLRYKLFPSGTPATLFTQAAYADTIAEAGLRAMVAGFNSSGLGAGQCRVLDFTVWASPEQSKAFGRAFSEVPVVANFSAGKCTAGTHYFGYVVETLRGGMSPPSPIVGGTFSPPSINLASGGRMISVTWNGPYPSDAYRFWLLMTRSDNPDKYYWVPNAQTLVPPGGSGPAVIYANISDENLALAEEATDQFSVLGRDPVTDLGPFNPSVVIPYGKRVVYIVDQEAYVSDPEEYQTVTEDFNVIILPGRLRIMTGFAQRGLLYLVGPHWTYVTADNNDYPSTWAQPEPVDSAIGTLSPRGVTTSKGSRKFTWVADEAGLYLFEGVYSDLPISYGQKEEWDRINWEAAHTLQVIDDHVNQRVIVIAPLDSATSPTHELVWDYTLGKTATATNFSLNNIRRATGDKIFHPGAVAMVYDPSDGKTRKWIAGADTGGKILKEDEDTHNDDSEAIESLYRTAPLPQEPKTQVATIQGYHIRIKGYGMAVLTQYSRDDVRQKGLYPIDLETAPLREALRMAHMDEEQVSLEIYNDFADEWWELSKLIQYWSPGAFKK